MCGDSSDGGDIWLLVMVENCVMTLRFEWVNLLSRHDGGPHWPRDRGDPAALSCLQQQQQYFRVMLLS
jgi:hypothetical protein